MVEQSVNLTTKGLFLPFYVPKTYTNDLFSVGPQYLIEGGCFQVAAAT